MHELSLVQGVVDVVGDHARGQTVKRVTLEIGKLAGVMNDALRFSFDLVTEGTTLEGALLEIREIEARARCPACGNVFIQNTLYTPCPCGSSDFERISGEELLVKEYELG
jgi:hydrogenase nickel incorporation protein HypA/HybF